jgi:hypothetical protein
MNKHTPGPWYYTNEGLNAMGIVEKDGTNIMHMHTLQNSTASRHMEANVRLIAAAPELLEAAEYVSKLLEYFVVKSEHCELTIDRLHAAIAKAKGEVMP